MFATEVIYKKRSGQALDAFEIAEFMKKIADWSLSDGQIASFFVTVFKQGLSDAEIHAMINAVLTESTPLIWPDTSSPAMIFADTFSNDSVSDYTGVVLPAVLAASGLKVPAISGHSKEFICGTLNKLSTAKGYNINPTFNDLKAGVLADGCAVIGITGEFSPLYHRIRRICHDTGTITSPYLATISVTAQKLLAGIKHLSFTIKFGDGTFIKDRATAQNLAFSVKEAFASFAIPAEGFIAPASLSVGHSIGAALELAEALAFLNSPAQPDFHLMRKAIITQATPLLTACGLADDENSAKEKITAVLDGKFALRKFTDMLLRFGASSDFFKETDFYLRKAPTIIPYAALYDGFIKNVKMTRLGELWQSLVLCAGDSGMAPFVGFSEIKSSGDKIAKGDNLLMIHAPSAKAATSIKKNLNKVFSFTDKPVSPIHSTWERV